MLSWLRLLLAVKWCLMANALDVSPTCDSTLGVDYDAPPEIRIPNSQLTASTVKISYLAAKYGRINQPRRRKVFGIWCADEKDTAPWFQVDLGKMSTITKLTIGANSFITKFVKSYSAKYSYNGTVWFDLTTYTKDGTLTKIFPGLKNYYDPKTVPLSRPITARYVRFYPKTKSGDTYCLQTDILGCPTTKVCTHAVGLENTTAVDDDKFTASSVKNKFNAHYARLHSRVDVPKQWGGWCGGKEDRHPWIQIDLGYAREVSAVVTQGHPWKLLNAWTKEYSLNYSLNGKQWNRYMDNRTFIGNWDGNESKINTLDPPVTTRFLRLLPLDWNNLACLRMEVLECLPRKDSIPQLDAGLTDTTIMRGEQFTFTCAFSGQPGIKMAWHINGGYLPTDARITTSYAHPTQQSVLGKLHFARLKSSEDATRFACVAWYPDLDTVYAQSQAVLNVLSPIPILRIENITATSISVVVTHSGNKTADTFGYVINMQRETETVRLDVIRKLLYNRSVNYTLAKHVRPYTNYSLRVAMLYIENETGEFTEQKQIQTQQARPYAAPLDLKVDKISHNALLASWRPPAKDMQNGPIVMYQVQYLKSVKKKQIPIVRYVTSNVTNARLSNLEPGANYEVSVRAYTVIGGGPFTHPPVLIFTGKATEELNTLNEVEISTRNAAGVGVRLKNITADPQFLNKYDVTLTLDILEKVVHVENGSALIGESLVAAVSNVLKANETVLAQSEITNKTGTRYVKVLEKWLEDVKPTDKVLEEKSENVLVRKVFLHKLQLEEGIKFADASGAEITIPKEALQKNKSEESVYFVYYKQNKFFKKHSVKEELCVNGFTVVKEQRYTPVMSGEVVGAQTRNLTAPVVLKFKANSSADLKESACVYWDFAADNKKGAWRKDGCRVYSVVNQTITCHCNHLTNFAAIMDIYAHTSRVCGIHKKVISWISVVGCFLSVIGLFLTFITYLLFRHLLREMAAKVLVQLCFALLVVTVTFMTGFEQTAARTLCTGVAVTLHYFTLVVFMWMLMEALFMYHAFVKVWPPQEGNAIYKTTAVAWGVPFIIVLVTFLADMDSYGGKHYCHITGTPLFASYLAPIGMIIMLNFVIFIFIMYHLSTRPSSTTDKSKISMGALRVKRAFGIMILMGLTWGFGFGTASSARLEFSYLFAICNAFQGFAIFIFYTVAQPTARTAWYKFFTCDTRSELKRTTDSYYEGMRRRMSSGASNKTNTLQFHRTASAGSSVYQQYANNSYSNLNPDNNQADNKTSSGIRASDSSHIAMQPIFEVDSPPSSPQNQTRSTEMLAGVATPNIKNKNSQSSSGRSSLDDETLDMKLEREKPSLPTENYTSYRALSGSYDILNAVRSPSADCLSGHPDDIYDRRPSVNSDKTVENTPDNNNVTSTLKSDVATMTDVFENDDPTKLQVPLGKFRRPTDDTNVIEWLNECDKATEPDYDSDYSSSYYRTSRSSSVADLPMSPTCDVNRPSCDVRPPRSQSIVRTNTDDDKVIRDTILGTLKGSSNNTKNNDCIDSSVERKNHRNSMLSNKPNNRDSLRSDVASDNDDVIEDGYSASEEDILNDISEDHVVAAEKHARKKKLTRIRHNSSGKKGYVSLDDPIG